MPFVRILNNIQLLLVVLTEHVTNLLVVDFDIWKSNLEMLAVSLTFEFNFREEFFNNIIYNSLLCKFYLTPSTVLHLVSKYRIGLTSSCHPICEECSIISIQNMLNIMLETKVKDFLIVKFLIENSIELEYLLSLIEPITIICNPYCILSDMDNLSRILSLFEMLSQLSCDRRLALENCHPCFFLPFLLVFLNGTNSNKHLKVI